MISDYKTSWLPILRNHLWNVLVYLEKYQNFGPTPKTRFPTEVPIVEYWFMESLEYFFLINYNICSKSCTAYFISNW